MGYHRLAEFACLSFFVDNSSSVTHNSEKVVSLFIHIMPPVVLHTLLHLLPKEYAHEHYPAIQEVTSLGFWRGFWISSLVHTIWQGWYYYFIMVRRREKIAAGRPTSFTWLRRSYAKTWIGKWVNGLPEPVQPFAFMAVQVFPQIGARLTVVRLLFDDNGPMSAMVQQ